MSSRLARTTLSSSWGHSHGAAGARSAAAAGQSVAVCSKPEPAARAAGLGSVAAAAAPPAPPAPPVLRGCCLRRFWLM